MSTLSHTRAPGASRRWRPTPAVTAAIGAHLVGVAALPFEPLAWPWIAGFLASQHAAFFAAGFFPRSRLVGANISRLPEAACARNEIALTFDDGPDPTGTPELLELLARSNVKATFFCVGARVAQYPDIARAIVQQGHAIENHSMRHSETFAFMGPGRAALELERAQATIHDVIGLRPRFFRAPFGVRSPLLDPALHRVGLSYVSWTRRGLDTIDDNALRVSYRLTCGLAAGDILMLHDGVATRRGRIRRPMMQEVLARVFDAADSAGLKFATLSASMA